jgi:predicted DNA-binding transcriptional regulator YafY
MTNTTHHNQQKLIDYLIESFPDGMKTGELAQHLDVTPQTVRNYITALSEQGVCIQEESGHYTLDPADNPRQITLSLPQAWMLYLPLRRIVRANLNRRSMVRDLLRRVSDTMLQRDLAQQLQEPAAVEDLPIDSVFEALVEGWRRGTYVQIRYRAPDSQPTRMMIAPWWFEPAVWSDSNYIIGAVKQGEHIKPISLKLDRILDAKPLQARFDRPDPDALLQRVRESWGIWQGESDPVRVVLRFANRQYDRLRETHWHPTEQTFIDAEGSVLWEALISEPREMKPWIRGWGPDVEVLEPDWLRSEIASEAAQTARIYGQNFDDAGFF